MQYKHGLVSVVIPTYRRADMLSRAVRSVLAQTYPNIEVLVVSDNEPDDEFTAAARTIVAGMDDPRVRLLTQDRHINGAAARNHGIKCSQGEFIAFLDDDDEWEPRKVQIQLDYLKANQDCDGVTCLIKEYKGDTLIWKRPAYTADNLQLKVLKGEVSVGTVTLLLKRDALDETGNFNEGLKRHQELQLITAFLAKKKLGIINEYLVNVHVDDASNRPNVEKIIQVKTDFISAVQQYIDKYPTKIQKEIIHCQYIDIIHIALREKKFGIALKYFCHIGIFSNVYKTLYIRLKNKRNR